jgi:hypothetical protein
MRGGPLTRGLHINLAAKGYMSLAHRDADLAEILRIRREPGGARLNLPPRGADRWPKTD